MPDFRKEALHHMHHDVSSDVVFVMSKPSSRITVIILTLLCLLLVLWLVFGTITQREQGKGILISEHGRVYDAVTQKSGLILKVPVKPGDEVSKDKPLVELERLDLKTKITLLVQEIELLEHENKQLNNDYKKEKEVWQTYLVERTKSLQQIVQLQQSYVKEMKKNLPARKKMADLGVMSKIMMEDQVRIYNQSFESLNRNINDLIKIKRDLIKFDAEWQQRILDNKQELLAKRIELNNVRKDYELASKVVSPIDGIVTAVKTTPGRFVKEGTPLVTVSQVTKGLQAIIFIPASNGVIIQKGMQGLIQPAGVENEIYGALKATVREVQSFPASKQEIVSILQNEQLAESLLEKEKSLILIRLDLTRDDTISGYKWTSGEGYPGKIYAGSLCTAEIVTRKRRPISLIIPTLRKIMGVSH